MQLLSLLHEHPEWREPLRQMLLPEEILRLPEGMAELRESVRELAEAQKRTEQRVEELAEAQKRTEQRVEELAEAQKRTEQRVEELAEAQKRTEQRVEELAEAQKRTEQLVGELAKRVDELAEAQKRTEQRVEELAEAQKRTEQQVGELAKRVDELAEAQKRTEQRVEELAEAQKRTEQQVGELAKRVDELAIAQKRTDEKVDRLASELGGLKSLIGASLEDEASAVLEWVIRKKGYRILSPPVNLAVNGEVDVILRAQDKEGKTITVVLESKARMSHKDVVRWVQRMRSSGFRKRLAKAGYDAPYLVYVHGIRVDGPAQEAAKEHGIGVLKGEGEVLAPQGFLAGLAEREGHSESLK